MTEAQSTSMQGPAGGSSSPPPPTGRTSSNSSWIPPIPRPLQRLFDSVPLVTYPANELPYRSPASVDGSLPTLHIFTSERDAAKGWPSFNPSCLKWQTYLRMSGIPHNVAPSTNHASPTGSLPFLLPALSSIPEKRLDTRPLLPIPSSRLETYASRHTKNKPAQEGDSASSPEQLRDAQEKVNDKTSTSSNFRRQQAYQSLLDTPIRNAWLYTLYLSPANEPLLRKLYLRPVSRTSLIQQTILVQLRRAARAEIAKTTSTPTPTETRHQKSSWSISFGGGEEDEDGETSLLKDLLTWAAVGGRPTIDPEIIYAEAQKAFEALEAALTLSSPSPTTTAAAAAAAEPEPEVVSWFFNAPQPTLFDAATFSYTYLLLASEGNESRCQDKEESHLPWGDDTIRRIIREHCPKIVAHAQRILKEYWGDVQGLQVS